ncbi:lipid-A-disaccharide synthase-related protein [Synechococcus sp. CBW1006]|uniref:lipid-A-disaccharide synthase-related protein n=1 Tax=Synechococcus sp. CBW1006 TaxID=1353138 RepID=UPI0018CE33E5|nr:lipid-A-disaccharide synthase-related protein [Synechococcus sp. CBW1006]QPN67002.1 sugar synthetase [Synechococcus sp. CBW1006]
MPSRLLVLSNGHGEDLIALRILEALREQQPDCQLTVMALVGLGQTYAAAEAAGWLQVVGPRRCLPSGGFSNQSLRGLLRDLRAGLPLLSLRQWRWVRHWGRAGHPVLAVGDLLPLLLAWSGGGPYGFVGTPKSDATWATPPPPGWGRPGLDDRYHRCKGSEWDPWEWALMRADPCRLVAVRDRLTARGLRNHGVAALAPGNPMMDGFQTEAVPIGLRHGRRLLLLPGSRLPEALGNLERLLEAALQVRVNGPLHLLLACGNQPTSAELAPLLSRAGFSSTCLSAEQGAIGARDSWRAGTIELHVGPGCFGRWAAWCELGLATAGTATEQLVGLGVPALSLPGPGPQFKPGFARRQSRLLGGAVLPCHTAAELARTATRWLDDAELRQRLGTMGRRRMGPAGGSQRLAKLITQHLLA